MHDLEMIAGQNQSLCSIHAAVPSDICRIFTHAYLRLGSQTYIWATTIRPHLHSTRGALEVTHSLSCECLAEARGCLEAVRDDSYSLG